MKVGLDDYFAKGHSPQDLLALATDQLKPLTHIGGGPGGVGDASSYYEQGGCIWWDKPTRDDIVPTRLTNFVARITAEIVRDDGVEAQILFEIEARRGDTQRKFTISVQQFMSMNWAVEHLGATAIVAPGMGLKDHARAAIQTLSPHPARRIVYAHIGWRQINGVAAYLHAGGAIGPNGTVPGIEVDVPGRLGNFELPEPPTGPALHAAVRASLGLIDLAKDSVTAPLLAMVYRAPLGICDLSGHLVGRSGAYKSECAALAQQHFGAKLVRTNLLSWSSTGNAIELLEFAAKDALLVVDDFAPTGTAADVARLHRDADRVFRGAGNRAGRTRLGPDVRLRPDKPPRSITLSTGEDVPRGHSLQARVVMMDVPAAGAVGAIDVAHLTKAQADAESGLLAQAMAAYIAWLAERHDRWPAEVREEFLKRREQARGLGSHTRDPEKLAHLATGWTMFLRFAQARGAVSADQAAVLFARSWGGLLEVTAAQADYQHTSDPVVRFIELLASAISSGEAAVVGPDGGAPSEVPERWGWSLRPGGSTTEWQHRGKQVGWVDGEDLYLDPQAALRAANAMAGADGDGIALGCKTLGKRLHQAKLLASTDAARGRLVVRRALQGSRPEVWHLRAGDVVPPGDRPNRPNGPTPPEASDSTGTDGQPVGDGLPEGTDESSPESSHPHEPPEPDPAERADSRDEGDDWANSSEPQGAQVTLPFSASCGCASSSATAATSSMAEPVMTLERAVAALRLVIVGGLPDDDVAAAFAKVEHLGDRAMAEAVAAAARAEKERGHDA